MYGFGGFGKLRGYGLVFRGLGLKQCPEVINLCSKPRSAQVASTYTEYHD